MKTLFHTVITSRRHREHGYCEDSDFGRLELIELSPEEKQLVVSFKDGDEAVEYIEYKGQIYKKVNSESRFCGLSRDEENAVVKKQGKFSVQETIKFVLAQRKSMEHGFSNVGDETYILIGRTLYSHYCKKSELGITYTGNLLFSYWLSINIQSHFNLKVHKLSKKNFEKIVKEQKARFDADMPAEGTRRAKEAYFSCPTQVKWGEKYL